ncbi:hypothetical protein J2S00_000435 [Caldalkalibacillus uzonensis]|uniref:ABC transporter periplasmic binding protein yphF n=1 Tax=Caldalkalibacillus uzonensis TaxID=353224 RepID=A0ABU0CQ74_9BACI|nr:hypothetical protein [Caldalkalibacillus uzonensis]MDQ0337665.1 hypothetical protein [Caldalkalibacillus uzonensis]
MKVKYTWILLFVVLLSGCMYPYEHKVKQAPPHPQQMEAVQQSVNQFRAETGVLPIYTTEADTPIYHKYVIDFGQLIPRYMSEPPVHSYEGGGHYRYVLINVETEPEVKLIDLRLSQKVADLQRRVNYYLSRNPYLPIDQMLEGGYFTLDYKKLGLKSPPTVESPYSQQSLPLIVDQRGQVGIDYRIDLYQALENRDDVHQLQEGEDIRFVLTDISPFVPAHSFPYTLEDGEPVFIESWKRYR